MPSSGPQNNVHLLLKGQDEKEAKMHFSALVAEPKVLSGENLPLKADCGASCERLCGDSKSVCFDSGSTRNHGGPSRPVHRQNRRCDSVLQHQVRSIRTVYIQTAQKTAEVVSATERTVEIHQVWFIDRIVDALVIMLRPVALIRSKQCSHGTLLA